MPKYNASNCLKFVFKDSNTHFFFQTFYSFFFCFLFQNSSRIIDCFSLNQFHWSKFNRQLGNSFNSQTNKYEKFNDLCHNLPFSKRRGAIKVCLLRKGKHAGVTTNVYSRKTLEKPKNKGLRILRIRVRELFTCGEGVSTPCVRHKG